MIGQESYLNTIKAMRGVFKARDKYMKQQELPLTMPHSERAHSERAHSKLGASSMYRWSKCPGSVKLCEQYPSTGSSEYADEGTQAHEIAAAILTSNRFMTVENDEIRENLRVYIKYIDTVHTHRKTSLLVEHRFSLEEIYTGLFGTCDAIVFDSETKILHVIDLKYGKGIPVSVQNNPQLMYYALGALYNTDFKPEIVRMTIVQPRCEHPDGYVRSQDINVVDLLEFEADLVEYAKATEKEDAPLIEGKHCRFCSAAPFCPKLHEKAMIAATSHFSPINETYYDPEKLSEYMKLIPKIETWIKAVQSFAFEEAKAGRIIPGYKLVEKRATRKWIDESTLEKALVGYVDEMSMYETKIKSPAQMEKLLPKDKRYVIEELTVKESSGYNLVPEEKQIAKSSTSLEWKPIEIGEHE